MNERQGRRSLFRWIVSPLLILLVVELGLRVAGWDGSGRQLLPNGLSSEDFQIDPELGWLPHAQREDLNAWGMRGGDWSASGPLDLDIVHVGASITYGLPELDRSYPLRLEERLQRQWPHRRLRSAILAVPGYSVLQCRRLLETWLESQHADVCVLHCGAWNDAAPAALASDEVMLERRAPPLRCWALIRDLSDRRRMLSPAEQREAVDQGLAPHGPRVSPKDFRHHLKSMVDLLQQRDLPVVLLVPASPASTQREHPQLEAYRQIVREIGVDCQVPFLDLSAVVAEACTDNIRENELFSDWIHPNQSGHELIASSVQTLISHALQGHSPSAHERVGARTEQVESDIPTLMPPASALSTNEGFSLTLRPQDLDLQDVSAAWAGRRSLRVQRGGPEVLLIEGPALSPGHHTIDLVTPAGLRRVGQWHLTAPTIVVRAMPPVGGGDLGGAAPDESAVFVWSSRKLLREAVPTSAGDFWLDLGGDLDLRKSPLPLLELPKPQKIVHASNGEWRLRWSPSEISGADEEIFIQALINCRQNTKRGPSSVAFLTEWKAIRVGG